MEGEGGMLKKIDSQYGYVRKVFGCFVIGMLLMSVVPRAVMAQNTTTTVNSSIENIDSALARASQKAQIAGVNATSVTITNGILTLQTGPGFNNQGVNIVNAEISDIGIDFVWYGEYEYVGVDGEQIGPYPDDALPSDRILTVLGPNQYKIEFAEFKNLEIAKTVTIPAGKKYAELKYTIKNTDINPHTVKFYYSIDYCEGGSDGYNVEDYVFFPNKLQPAGAAGWYQVKYMLMNTGEGPYGWDVVGNYPFIVEPGQYTKRYYIGFYSDAIWAEFNTGYGMSYDDYGIGIEVDLGTLEPSETKVLTLYIGAGSTLTEANDICMELIGLAGETSIFGNVTNTTNYPIENVDVYLYNGIDRYRVLHYIDLWRYDPTTPVPPYIAHTKTNSTGNYNFTALAPGSYLVLAVPPPSTDYLPEVSDVHAVAKNEIKIINLKLKKRYLAALDNEMIDIRDLSKEIVNNDTWAAADVYVCGYNTFVNKDIDVDVLSLVLDAINFAMNLKKPSIPKIHYVANLIGENIGIPLAEHGLHWAIAKHWEDVWNTDFQDKLATYASQVNKLNWLKNFDYASSVDDALKNGYYTTDIYKNSLSAIDDSFDEYDKLAYNETAPDFSLSETENVLKNQVNWLKGNDIADGIIITPKGNVYLFKTAQAHRHDFYNAKAEMEAAETGEKISDAFCTAGHLISFMGKPEVGVPVQVVAWVAGAAFSTFELYAQNKMAKQWSYTQVYWVQDLDTIPKIINDTVEWLKNETDDPRLPYVNGEIIDTDIHPFITIGDKQFVWANKPDYPWWWILPKLRWWVVNNNTVKIKSTSLIDDVKTRILCIDRYGNEIISEEPTIYPNATEPPMLMDKNEIKTIDLIYVGDFQIFNPFHWHYLSTILWMEGKQPDIETDIYYVIPLPFSPLPYAAPNKSTMSAQKKIDMLMKQPIRSEICAYTTAKSHSPITLEEWISLVGNCTKIIDTSLDPINISTQVEYTTNASITNVTFLMVTIPGSYIDLHVYDEAGRHIGYDPITDSDEIQIPSGTYTGSDSNPEIITIPLAASKTFTISVNATQFASSSPIPVEVYAIETPVRPAVLGISPAESHLFISPGETKNITIQLAEVGEQVDIEDVTIIIHNFTDMYGNMIPNVTISVSPDSFNNISAGTEAYFSISFNASEIITLPNVPETRYTGNVTINTSNAGEINVTLSVLILDTDLPNVKLTFAEPNVTGVHVLGLDLSAVDETYKPEGITPLYAYMINSTGAGNFTLRFTNIPNANTIIVYKIDPKSEPPNQWIELDATTTADTVTFTMSVGDPPVVFCSGAAPAAARVPALTPIGIIALAGLLAVVAVSRIRRKK